MKSQFLYYSMKKEGLSLDIKDKIMNHHILNQFTDQDIDQVITLHKQRPEYVWAKKKEFFQNLESKGGYLFVRRDKEDNIIASAYLKPVKLNNEKHKDKKIFCLGGLSRDKTKGEVSKLAFMRMIYDIKDMIDKDSYVTIFCTGNEEIKKLAQKYGFKKIPNIDDLEPTIQDQTQKYKTVYEGFPEVPYGSEYKYKNKNGEEKTLERYDFFILEK